MLKKFTQTDRHGNMMSKEMVGKFLKKKVVKDRHGNQMAYEFDIPESNVPPMNNVPQYSAEGGDAANHPGGPKGSDTVPAWLTPGEFVVNKEATDIFGDIIEKMNDIGKDIQDKKGAKPDGLQNVPYMYARDGTRVQDANLTSWINDYVLDSLRSAETGPAGKPFMGQDRDIRGDLVNVDGKLGTIVNGTFKPLVSKAKAMGLYQIMPENLGYKDGVGAGGFGTPVITEEDAWNPVKARAWAKAYLEGIQREFPHWSPREVLQAYNWGPGALRNYKLGHKTGNWKTWQSDPKGENKMPAWYVNANQLDPNLAGTMGTWVGQGGIPLYRSKPTETTDYDKKIVNFYNQMAPNPWGQWDSVVAGPTQADINNFSGDVDPYIPASGAETLSVPPVKEIPNDSSISVGNVPKDDFSALIPNYPSVNPSTNRMLEINKPIPMASSGNISNYMGGISAPTVDMAPAPTNNDNVVMDLNKINQARNADLAEAMGNFSGDIDRYIPEVDFLGIPGDKNNWDIGAERRNWQEGMEDTFKDEFTGTNIDHPVSQTDIDNFSGDIDPYIPTVAAPPSYDAERMKGINDPLSVPPKPAVPWDWSVRSKAKAIVKEREEWDRKYGKWFNEDGTPKPEYVDKQYKHDDPIATFSGDIDQYIPEPFTSGKFEEITAITGFPIIENGDGTYTHNGVIYEHTGDGRLQMQKNRGPYGENFHQPNQPAGEDLNLQFREWKIAKGDWVKYGDKSQNRDIKNDLSKWKNHLNKEINLSKEEIDNLPDVKQQDTNLNLKMDVNRDDGKGTHSDWKEFEAGELEKLENKLAGKDSKATNAENKSNILDELLKKTQDQPGPDELDSGAETEAKKNKKELGKVEGFLKGLLGSLFDKDELKRMAVMYAGSRLMGYGHGGSLNFAVKNYIARTDAKDAANQTFAMSSKAQETYTAGSLQTFRETGDMNDLIEKGKPLATDGTVRKFGRRAGTGKREYVEAQKYWQGSGEDKQVKWITKDGRTINPLNWTLKKHEIEDSDEYLNAVEKYGKKYGEELSSLRAQFGTIKRSSGDKPAIYKTDINPKNHGGEIIRWALENDVPLERMSELIKMAYDDAIADAPNREDRITDLIPYLNGLRIRDHTPNLHLFKQASKTKLQNKIGPYNGPPVDAKRFERVRQKIISIMNIEPSFRDDSDFKKTNDFIRIIETRWDNLGKTPEETKKLQETWWKKAKKLNSSGFLEYLNDELQKETELLLKGT